MKFICEKHRESLQQSPVQALAHWEEWMSQGSSSLEQDKLQKAISYFGCCYELSEMLVVNTRDQSMGAINMGAIAEKFSAVDRLMLSGHLLAESLGRSGNIPLERHYLLAVHHHLTKFMTRREQCPGRNLRKNLEISLLMLHRHCKRHGEFSGFQACLLQACQLFGQAANSATLH